MKPAVNKTEKVTRRKGRNVMTCQRCQRDAGGHDLCDSCFRLIIERRVVKELRKLWKNRRKPITLYVKDPVSKALIKAAIPEDSSHEQFRIIGTIENESIPINSATADDLAARGLHEIFQSKKPACEKSGEVMPFRNITKHELARYASLSQLSYKTQSSDIGLMLEKLEKSYPGTVHATVKSMATLGYLKAVNDGESR